MSLSESLRQLPEHEPPPGGWSELARRMDGPRARRRRSTWKPVLFAAAASAVITSSITVQIMKSPDVPPTASAPSTKTVVASATPNPSIQRVSASAADPRLARLMHRSQELERVLALVRPETNVWDASLQARTETIERGLSYIDLQLNYAQANGQQNQALRLWENRVQLMTELVATHRNARLPASAGPENSI